MSIIGHPVKKTQVARLAVARRKTKMEATPKTNHSPTRIPNNSRSLPTLTFCFRGI